MKVRPSVKKICPKCKVIRRKGCLLYTSRQGSGKGAPVGWCAPVKPGRVLYEIKGVSLDLAREALTRAAHKLPVKTIIVVREGL